MISNVTLNCGDDVAISVCRLVIHCASDCVTRCAMSQYRDAGVVAIKMYCTGVTMKNIQNNAR